MIPHSAFREWDVLSEYNGAREAVDCLGVEVPGTQRELPQDQWEYNSLSGETYKLPYAAICPLCLDWNCEECVWQGEEAETGE